MNKPKVFAGASVSALLAICSCVACTPDEKPKETGQIGVVASTAASRIATEATPSKPHKIEVKKSELPKVKRTTQAPKPKKTEETSEPEPKVTYRPGAFCATSKLGEQFTKNGTTYECSGPKPYRWRKI